ncbi:SAM-dependent methyltransferase [Paenibacillus sp. N1-5-1-14]|uniref:class I SAM-dependent methyltransferase n=1 Tax=Paenibacillus radicibacter TaxID=2972488 RepID=UPI002158D14B|nr:SAM-dependent methyltransferase [Paenibacillus radicibacter]MCR8641944.1 SAM-dependent methyltransferase [Paenibacillus radicibacter]
MVHRTGKLVIIDALKQLIANSPIDMISFRDYMDLCLYHETAGYYRSRQLKIGREGDFYTSSSVGTIMGEMIGQFILTSARERINASDPLHVAEWGGGNGNLALHALDEILKNAPERYANLQWTMIETSSFHRELQQQTLHKHADKVIWVDDQEWLFARKDDYTIVIANELLDAFPVHRIRCDQGILLENWVGWDEEKNQVIESWLPLQNNDIVTYLEKGEIQLIDNQVAEINLAAPIWTTTILNSLHQGHVVVIDYGDVASEIYSAHRLNGTLLCYRKHQAHDNPYVDLGEQDMTAHVDFSSCMREAAESGAISIQLQTQREFLVEQGVFTRLQQTMNRDPFSIEAKRNRSIRQLLLSDGMSELFKVMIISK